MKKLLLALALGLSLCSICPQVAHAQKLSVSGARSQIQTCYNRYGQAMKSKNLNMINSLLAADYTMHNFVGKTSDRSITLNKNRFLFNLPTQMTRYETRITSIQARGNDMIVMTQVNAESVARSGIRSTNSKIIATYRDFWSPARNSNGWMLRQSVELSAQAWVDGKKMM